MRTTSTRQPHTPARVTRPDDMPRLLRLLEAHHGFALAIVFVPLVMLAAAWVSA